MTEQIRLARVVITHAGIGSYLTCLNLNKVPIIFPREKKLGEHIDDHQLDFAQKISSTGRLPVAFDESELLEKIINYNSVAESIKVEDEHPEKSRLINFLQGVVS